ncbi:EXS family-domain-containing protein [Sphaerosporella brunnea]|uniref:EXS family-domain-containing protein n=1 Tax=Sphaerosporella brunnea TaxID=1250544 RepID=A0A5J5FBX3_9PEZI|nr:EXS family-domain-containing protein [Sphaerosporella brunnea]
MELPDAPLEPISLWLPLPYRVILLFIIGLWLFSFNLHYLHLVRIDIGPFLRYTRSPSEPPLHRSVYQLNLLLTFLFTSNLFLFWFLTGGRPDDVQRWELLPLLLFMAIAATFLMPIGSWHKRGRFRFLRMCRRVFTGGLDSDLRFADVLLADVLTSYAKVLGDVAMVVCMFWTGYSSTHPMPNRSCGGALLVPAVISIPYICRLRQCLIEYFRASSKGLTSAERRVHLFNACKYASAFPVIIIGAMQRGNYFIATSDEEEGITREELTHGWYIAVLLNSLFAFYWDVTRDWNLTLLTSSRSSTEYPYGLRKTRHYVAPEFYYVAIALDFLLRFAWSVKLSPHLDFLNEMEGGIFALELLEIFRRWIWVFFRVEREWISSREAGFKPLQQAEEGGIMMSEMRE